MSDFEKLMVKLKLIELAQNQTLIALKAFEIDKNHARRASVESNMLLEAAREEAEKYL